MAEVTVKIVNRRGLHARAAAKFVQLAETFGPDAAVTVAKDDMQVCGTSIMGLLMLSASMNTHIRIVSASGDAVTALAALVSARFDEAE